MPMRALYLWRDGEVENAELPFNWDQSMTTYVLKTRRHEFRLIGIGRQFAVYEEV